MNRLARLALGLIAIAGTAAAKDLAGVYEDATHSDPVIRQADANRLAAREARPQAWAAVMPQIVGSASILKDHSSGYQDTISEIPNPADPSTPLLQPLPLPSTIDTTTRGWAVNLRSNLFSWTNWMQIKAASAEVAQAEANYQAAEQDLILRVATAYFLVLSAEANVEANTAALEAITHQLDQANKRFEVGLIAITDVQDAKAGHDNAAAAVIQAKRQLATAQYRLQEITGQQYDRLSRPGADLPLKGPEPVDESAWVDISLAQNLSLISSRLAADIARDNVRAAVGGHLPTLDLVAGRSYTKGESTQTLNYLPPFDNVDNKFNDHQVGLQFTLPIFSGGFTQSKVRENQYRWIAAKEAVVQSSRATERQARDAYLGVISGIARVQALRQAARVEPDRAQGHRGRVRRRHAYFGGRAGSATRAGAGRDRLRQQQVRLHRERAAAARGGRHPRPCPAAGGQRLADGRRTDRTRQCHAAERTAGCPAAAAGYAAAQPARRRAARQRHALASAEQRLDQTQQFRQRTAIGLHAGAPQGAGARAQPWVTEQRGHPLTQFVRVTDHLRSTAAEQQRALSMLLELCGPVRIGTPDGGRLQQIVAADAHQAAADEGHVCGRVEAHQLAQGIQQQHLAVAARGAIRL